MKSMIACLLVLAVTITQTECYENFFAPPGSNIPYGHGLYPNTAVGISVDYQNGEIKIGSNPSHAALGAPTAYSSGVRAKRQVFGGQTIPFNFQMPYAFIPGGYIALPPSSYIAPDVPAPGSSSTSPTPGQ
ncbi:hypothetical protein DAPPUDRAFT_256991 [Daphnia pulex]|uniref:Uncharacterized protein n=1 Tax=Daphnia pulex TaxID=6669 RepID=E9HCM7_DAPPU|nr:hypothetical protein DAPPUDRAFT_256991 [Daphnia pulex]|eukprot:EFX70556.1 hypothetical protein DAPPUDRAFT_256991 [Daphnia pulex]